MGRPAPMHLSEDERDHVQVFVRRGKANARTLTQARVLLKSHEGWTDAEIAEVLDMSEQTIRTIRQRFCAGGVDAVLSDNRQERRRQALPTMTIGPCVCWQAKRSSWDMCEGTRRSWQVD